MKRIGKAATALVTAFSLTACSAVYYLEGKEYKDEQSFQRATDQMYGDVLRQVTPLPSPVASKNLVFAFPGEAAVYAESVRRHTVAKGTAPVGIALEQYRNLAVHSVKSGRSFFDAIKKRGIYPEVTLVETSTIVNSIEPSATYDTLYFTEPSIGSGQYFYASSKHGKQVFAYDRSGKTPVDKTNSFLEAVQAFAIRE